MKLDLQMLRYRAASNMSLCAGHHEIRRSEDGDEVWVECDGKELNRLTVEGWAKETGLDVSHQVQLFIREVMFEHEQDVVGKVVIELLNRLEAGDADRPQHIREFLANWVGAGNDWPKEGEPGHAHGEHCAGYSEGQGCCLDASHVLFDELVAGLAIT